MKILSIHDLATIRKRAEHNLSLREESNEKATEKCYGLASGAQHLQILICGGTGCKASVSYTHLDVYKRQPSMNLSPYKRICGSMYKPRKSFTCHNPCMPALIPGWNLWSDLEV